MLSQTTQNNLLAAHILYASRIRSKEKVTVNYFLRTGIVMFGLLAIVHYFLMG